ncbi:MAG: hypothetical protein JWN67_5002 [Actinomycetia bacterium]|nr:hypothetical protein [Actinomycetes bacterium]
MATPDPSRTAASSSATLAFLAALMVTTSDQVPYSLADIINRPAWTAQAACRGRSDIDWQRPDPEPAALDICRTCPVIKPCTLHAYQRREIGTWGGMSDRARLGRSHASVSPKSRP